MSPYLSSFFIITQRRIKITEARAVHNWVLQMAFTPAPPSQPSTPAPPSQPSAENDSTVLDNNSSNTNDNADTNGPNSNASIVDPNSYVNDTNGLESPDLYKVHPKKKLRWLSADEMSIPDSVLSNYIPSHLLLLTHIIPGMNAKLNYFLMSWVH